jgi:hypothetical protein
MSIIREIKAAWRFLFPRIQVYGTYEAESLAWGTNKLYVLSVRKNKVTYRFIGSLKEYSADKRNFAYLYRKVS